MGSHPGALCQGCASTKDMHSPALRSWLGPVLAQVHHVVGHTTSSGLPFFSAVACDWKMIPQDLLSLLPSPFTDPLSVFGWEQNQDTFIPFFVFGGMEAF